MRFQVRRRSHCQKAEELYSSSTRLLGCSLPARASPAKRTPADNRIFPVAGAGAGMEMTGVYLSDVRRIRLLPAIVPLWCAPGSRLHAARNGTSAQCQTASAACSRGRRGSKPATASQPTGAAALDLTTRQQASDSLPSCSVGFSQNQTVGKDSKK
jgi:hypothetical protein